MQARRSATPGSWSAIATRTTSAAGSSTIAQRERSTRTSRPNRSRGLSERKASRFGNVITGASNIQPSRDALSYRTMSASLIPKDRIPLRRHRGWEVGRARRLRRDRSPRDRPGSQYLHRTPLERRDDELRLVRDDSDRGRREDPRAGLRRRAAASGVALPTGEPHDHSAAGLYQSNE